MNRIYKKLAALVLSFMLVFSYTATATEAVTEKEAAPASPSLSVSMSKTLVEAVVNHIIKNYRYDVDPALLYKAAFESMLEPSDNFLDGVFTSIYDCLDEYSTYFTVEEFNRFTESMKGEFFGIGVAIMEFSEGLLVTDVYKDSPAAAAGVMKGDIIISADGIDIRGKAIEESRSYIVGAEGTTVSIGIIRGDTELNFNIARGNVVTEPGFFQILDGNIGYIQLSIFDEHSDEFIKKALENFSDVKNIIVDLRYNPGGTLEDLCSIAELTLPKGPVMHLSYKNIEPIALENNLGNTSKRFVVLVNDATASAAEAFSAAVQDYNAGVVIGETTHGKGTMQIVSPMPFGGGYKLTVAEYLSPKKRTINKIGVEPDFAVDMQTVRYSDIYFEKVTYDRVLKVGDTGADVLAMEQRLSLMGYGVGVPDTVFDENTFYAVKKYQENAGLYPYGVLDITTQLSIHSALQTKDVVIDRVLEKAIELASGDMDEYIKQASTEREEAQAAREKAQAEKEKALAEAEKALVG